MAAVSALLVLSLVLALTGGIMWAVAANGDSPAASAREQFLADATQATLNLTTVNPADADTMIANIQSSSTGDLAKELEDPAARAQLAAQVKERGITEVPKIVSISTSALDESAGTGTALVFVAQTMSGTTDQQQAIRRQGISLDMTRVDGVWKVSSMARLFEGIGAAPGAGNPGAGGDPSQGATPPAETAPGN